jgi:hypothetical protein
MQNGITIKRPATVYDFILSRRLMAWREQYANPTLRNCLRVWYWERKYNALTIGEACRQYRGKK